MDPISIFFGAITKLDVTDYAIVVVLAAMLYFLYKYTLKPMHDRIKEMPCSDEIKALVEEQNEIEELNIEELTKKLTQISDSLKDLESLKGGSYREIKDMKEDIEKIKTMLNQFQGHMMYGGRRASDFGNQELR